MKIIKLAIVTLLMISFNITAGGIGNPIAVIDPFNRHMCVHLNPNTGEMDDYGNVRDFYSECEIFIHNETKNGPPVTHTTSTPISERLNVIFEGEELQYGLMPQAMHKTDTPGSHLCKFGLRYNPENTNN